MLRVYVSMACPGSAIAQRLAECLQTCGLNLPVELVDVDLPHAVVPEQIFATPIYTWNDVILFLGNPNEAVLLECVRTLYEQEPASGGTASNPHHE